MAKTTLSTVDLLNKRIALATQAQKPKWDVFNDLDEIYHIKGKPQESNAQMHTPDSWSNIETIAPRMVAKRPTLIFKARPTPFNKSIPQELQDRIQDVKGAVWEHWWDKDGAFVKNVRMVKGALRHGSKHARTFWKHEEQEVSNYQYDEQGLPVVGEDGKFIEIKDVEVTFDDASMETISNYDIFIDPEAKDLQSSQWIIYRFRSTINQLKEIKRYTNLDKLEGLLNNKDDNANAERSRNISGVGVLEDDSTIDRVTCYEMWQKGDKGIEVSTVAARSVEIEKPKPNPYKHRKYPFIKLDDNIIDEEYWSMGEIEPIMYFQWALDTYHSLDVTNRVQAMQPKWKVDGEIDEWELFNGKVIHTNTKTGDDATAYEVPDYTHTSTLAIELVKSTMDNGLGIHDLTRGDVTPGNQTAQGISIESNEANARFALKIQLYEEFLKDLGEQIIALYQQHKTDYFDVQIENEQGVKETQSISPAEISGESNIEVEGGSSRPANKEAERTDAMQIFQLTQPIQAQDPQFGMEVMDFVLDKFDGASKVKDALKTAYDRIGQQQQMQQEQMAQQQAQQEQVQGMQEQQNQQAQDEEAKIADHQAYLQHFSSQEKTINDQIKQLSNGRTSNQGSVTAVQNS